MSSSIQHPDFRLEPGRNCWRIARAHRASLIVDACDYFRIAREAMLKAHSQVMLMGWDLDTRVALDDREKATEAPVEVGAIVSWLADKRPDLKIYILAWDGEAYRYLGRGSTLFRIAEWARRPNIIFKLDHSHPRAASHHQKILVIDDSIAFCGGIDITGSRWDTRDHCDDHPGRRRPTTGRAYEPWHDAIMAVDAGAARSLGDLARIRWLAATGDKLEAAEPVSLSVHDYWPEELEPTFRDVDIGIARTRAKHESWSEVREIEKLFVNLIASARRFVYFETQYFASRVVGEAIARRLAEPDGPEFVVVNPKTGYGWLDEEVMGSARAELMRALEKRDRYGRFRIYYPVTKGGTDIYVHAKIMIVDDVAFRVGSANLNNRSMGLDSECDLLIDCRLPANEDAGTAIEELRADLLAEHLDKSPSEVRAVCAKTGSLIAAIERLRGDGRSLVPLDPPELNAVESAMARSELLDPEGPNEPFEPRARHRLLGGILGRR
ncbi:MAG TPA: phospholipase D-like domain-containing protein [Allosphingosinicella sp.]